METLSGFPFYPLVFTRDARLSDPAQAQALVDGVRQGATDLLVVSHGWNNDMAEAREMYETMLSHARDLLGGGHPAAGRTIAVAGIFWPSKKFADRDLIPGGAASIGTPADVAALQEQLDGLKGFFEAHDADALLAEARGLAPRLETSATCRERFGEIMISLAPDPVRAAEKEGEEVDTDRLRDFDGEELLATMSKPLYATPPAAADDDEGEGGAGFVGGAPSAAAGEGDAAGLGDLVGGIVGGARQAANLVTYYQMKKRAGIVGAEGLAPVLAQVRQAAPAIRIHLAGHSFGGRLVTAAALAGAAGAASSVSLLQAAYSHYALAKDYRKQAGADGFYRRVVGDGLATGPVIVTHTRNDRAVGLAYALASRLAGQVAAALGDANDKFGGMGSNGAQDTPEAVAMELQGPAATYAFARGKVHNLKADRFVTGHGDVKNPAVVNAVLHAVAAT